MWAALPLQPLTPGRRSSSGISSTKPPPQSHRIAAQARSRQDEEKLSGLGLAVASALNSNRPPNQHQNPARSKSKQPQSPPQKEESDEQRKQRKQLSGADVLIALQRATADKANKKKQKRDDPAAAAAVVSKGRNHAGRQSGGVPDFASVRPLLIKPEWNDRLEELETRLEQLLHG